MGQGNGPRCDPSGIGMMGHQKPVVSSLCDSTTG